MEVCKQQDPRLEWAQALVACLQTGDEAGADRLVGEMISQQENSLFKEVGRLTRDLHDSIKAFLADAGIAEIAAHEIPDASERLGHVITMTEEAANTSLNAVEQSLPLADELNRRAGALAGEWDRFRGRQMSLQEFRDLSGELDRFLAQVADHSGALHGKLSEVLMAQGFQDLTGQIIRQVITLIQDLESKLVELVRLSGSRMPEQHDKKTPPERLEGPAVPGLEQGNQVSSQDDVDDLLSSLGF
ncbi:MAG TPA: protein phosphatase CheZ [Sedimenticola sp.]|nr:protein phosphatase CheZ [Sedimenticola sp.]